MQTRSDIEKREVLNLASYAMKSRDARPRYYPESKHQTRTCYQRDRDRIVHCEAFRKLEYKTQVFAIFEGDYYRTRLTHTLEVAQIGRSIGRNLRLNEDLIEAIALAHDLGHPPFGHAGEEMLDEIMKKATRSGFNHNLRSYEIITCLERRYPQFSGLNLTGEVRVGILKHQTQFDRPGRQIKIPSFKDDLKDSPTLEALIVDAADSLAYLNHDVDDGLTSGCITEEDLMESELWTTAFKKIQGRSFRDDKAMMKYQIVKELIDVQVKDLLETSSERLKKLKFQSALEAKQYRKTVIGFSPSLAKQRDRLQKLLDEKLYHHYRVERMTSKAKRIIQDLFDVYIRNPKQLPPEVYRQEKGYGKSEKYQIVCHWIALMTDRAALDEHKRFFSPYMKV